YRAARFACHYASSKYAAEQAIQAAARQFTHVTFIILRPRGLFGAHDRVIIPRLLRQLEADRGVLRLPRGGEAMVDMTYHENAVHAMWLASSSACDALPSGRAYNITNGEARPLKSIVQKLIDELGMS
ncbi:NAD-dependent epimerase/dehydratase family protein, partial [Klebsiella pneumoniae]|nr:NAD-dependent epimerase/dehydratase family protein [Klebsiella pneumoniae]